MTKTAKTENKGRFIEKDVYLFFLLTARETPGVKHKVKGKMKMETSSQWVGTCESLGLKAVAPSVKEVFNTLEADIRSHLGGRTPKETTMYLLEHGLGLGYPAENADPKTAALQTILNCDPDLYSRMANIRLTILTPETTEASPKMLEVLRDNDN